MTCSRGRTGGNAAPAGTGPRRAVLRLGDVRGQPAGRATADGFTHTLLIRRSVSDPSEVAYALVHAPVATAAKDMIAVAGIRWRIGECNEQGKDLLGLDQHQVRTWTTFGHHVVVCMFAHAFAATRKARLHRDEHDEHAAGEGAHRGNGPAPSRTRRRHPASAGGGN